MEPKTANGPVGAVQGPANGIVASSVDDAIAASVRQLEVYAHAAATLAAAWDVAGMRYALKKARAHASNALQLLELAESAVEAKGRKRP